MPDTPNGPRAADSPSPRVLKNCNGCACLHTFDDIAWCGNVRTLKDTATWTWMSHHKPAGGLPSRFADGCPGFEPKP